MSQASQSVVDPQGHTWKVSFETVSGTMRYDNGKKFGNTFFTDISKWKQEGHAEPIQGTKADYEIVVHQSISDKGIAHEVAGHASGLADLYDVKTSKPNPLFPGNLMNNDDYPSGGIDLNCKQVEQIISPAFGNHVVGSETFRMKVRDRTGF